MCDSRIILPQNLWQGAHKRLSVDVVEVLSERIKRLTFISLQCTAQSQSGRRKKLTSMNAFAFVSLLYVMLKSSPLSRNPAERSMPIRFDSTIGRASSANRRRRVIFPRASPSDPSCSHFSAFALESQRKLRIRTVAFACVQYLCASLVWYRS